MLTANQLDLAQRDGHTAALRLLYSLRHQLDAYDDQNDAQTAAATFLLGFSDVFTECLLDAVEDDQGHGAMRLFYSIIKRTPELIAQLDR